MKATIRKATINDVQSISSVLKPYTEEGIVLALTNDEIVKRIDNFLVAQYNNEVVGVVSFYDYGIKLKEIRSLAVKKEFFKRGIGRDLVEKLVNGLTREFPDAKIFVLSYYPDFFKKLDFYEIDREELPEKIWKDCQNCKDRDNCGETALVLSGIDK